MGHRTNRRVASPAKVGSPRRPSPGWAPHTPGGAFPVGHALFLRVKLFDRGPSVRYLLAFIRGFSSPLHSLLPGSGLLRRVELVPTSRDPSCRRHSRPLEIFTLSLSLCGRRRQRYMTSASPSPGSPSRTFNATRQALGLIHRVSTRTRRVPVPLFVSACPSFLPLH